MSGNPQRKMLRTKRELAMIAENSNRNALNILMKDMNLMRENTQEFIKQYNNLVEEVAKFQFEYIVLFNTLKKLRLIDELVMGQERTRLNEMRRLEAQAHILDANKPQKEEPQKEEPQKEEPQKEEEKTEEKNAG